MLQLNNECRIMNDDLGSWLLPLHHSTFVNHHSKFKFHPAINVIKII